MSQPNKQLIHPTIHIQQVQNSSQQQYLNDSSDNQSQQQIVHQQQQPQKNQLSDKDKDQQNQQDQRNVDGVTIFCRICQDFIAHSVTTPCQHTFCQLCLTQYMLYIDQCPQCGARIRHHRLSNNILLDNLIIDYIKKYQPKQVQIFQQRIQQFKTYQKDKKLNQFKAGDKIDIRDTDYVWCTGKILKSVNKIQQKKIKWMIVKYDKSNKKQQLPQNSPRVAPHGFYTARKDIPKYNRGKLILQNQQENVIYSIPNNYDDDQEKQKQKQKESEKVQSGQSKQ